MKWIVNNIFQFIQLCILARVILSWIPHDPYNYYIRTLYNFTDLILEPIRDILPLRGAPFDVSPIIAIFIIDFFKNIILGII